MPCLFNMTPKLKKNQKALGLFDYDIAIDLIFYF